MNLKHEYETELKIIFSRLFPLIALLVLRNDNFNINSRQENHYLLSGKC